MLEVVGVNLAALGDEVGLDVVAELNNLEVDALLGQNLLGHVQNLGMGRGEAATFRVVPASSLVSAVDSAAAEEAAVLSVEAASEDAATESVDAEEPQAASDRAREAASVAEISFSW